MEFIEIFQLFYYIIQFCSFAFFMDIYDVGCHTKLVDWTIKLLGIRDFVMCFFFFFFYSYCCCCSVGTDETNFHGKHANPVVDRNIHNIIFLYHLLAILEQFQRKNVSQWTLHIFLFGNGIVLLAQSQFYSREEKKKILLRESKRHYWPTVCKSIDLHINSKYFVNRKYTNDKEEFLSSVKCTFNIKYCSRSRTIHQTKVNCNILNEYHSKKKNFFAIRNDFIFQHKCYYLFKFPFSIFQINNNIIFNIFCRQTWTHCSNLSSIFVNRRERIFAFCFFVFSTKL